MFQGARAFKVVICLATLVMLVGCNYRAKQDRLYGPAPGAAPAGAPR
jgi:hypothetical protein